MQDEKDKIWFLYSKETVSGPFTELEIKEKINLLHCLPADLIWKRGNREWQKIAMWKEPSKIAPVPAGAEYYVLFDGLNSGPYAHSTLIEKLKSKELPLSINLWTEGLHHWVSVYETPSVIEQIGFARRKHVRVPFVGNVHFNQEDGAGESINVVGISLSEGGMAIKHLSGVEVGQELSLTVDSPLLNYSIYAKSIVMYRKQDEIGLQFSQLSVEGRGAVIEYVKQFQPQNPQNKFKKTQF